MGWNSLNAEHFAWVIIRVVDIDLAILVATNDENMASFSEEAWFNRCYNGLALVDSLHGFFKVITEIGELIIEGLSEVIENVPGSSLVVDIVLVLAPIQNGLRCHRSLRIIVGMNHSQGEDSTAIFAQLASGVRSVLEGPPFRVFLQIEWNVQLFDVLQLANFGWFLRQEEIA